MVLGIMLEVLFREKGLIIGAMKGIHILLNPDLENVGEC